MTKPQMLPPGGGPWKGAGGWCATQNPGGSRVVRHLLFGVPLHRSTSSLRYDDCSFIPKFQHFTSQPESSEDKKQLFLLLERSDEKDGGPQMWGMDRRKRTASWQMEGKGPGGGSGAISWVW